VRDTSLKVPHGESGKVIDVRVFSRDDSMSCRRREPSCGSMWPERKISEATSSPVATAKGSHLEDPADRGHAAPRRRHTGRHHPEPARCPSRMNVGQVLEAHLGYAARWGWQGADKRVLSATSCGHRDQDAAEHGPAIWVSTPSSTVRTGTRRKSRRTRRSRSCSGSCSPTLSTPHRKDDRHRRKATLYTGARRALRQHRVRGLRLHPEARAPRR